MKPFLVAIARPPGKIAVDERRALLKLGHLDESQLIPFELDQHEPSLPELSHYSGVIITGSPYNYLASQKSDSQRRTQDNVLRLCERLLAEDFPTLGLCYGLQMLAVAGGGTLSREFPEDMGAYAITLNDAGKADPLTGHLPEMFYSYVAHSESIATLPKNFTVLGSSETTPIHLGRFGSNIYGTQHHPEIDTSGIRLRIEHYVGVYLAAEDHDDILHACTSVRTEHGLISGFTSTYGS
ncbi:gamma-glutamyl-gamma-aminobutyrate hydrolase family protein [Arcanobacterium haemolyticum]|nr:gamma-glutamyl-gamma-aminobutyrate hydrolase family protein [Arcanobacterium haemolyticum]